MKRGELSMEVIIIAAIALLVLVILSVLIIRAATNTSQGTACEGVGGRCEAVSSCGDLGPGFGRSFQTCGQEGYICCIPVGQSE